MPTIEFPNGRRIELDYDPTPDQVDDIWSDISTRQMSGELNPPGNMVTDYAKGVGRGIEGQLLGGTFGGGVELAGLSMQHAKTIPVSKIAGAAGQMMSPLMPYGAQDILSKFVGATDFNVPIPQQIQDVMSTAGKGISPIGKAFKEKLQKMASEGWEAPEPSLTLGMHPFRHVAAGLGESTPMMAAAGIITARTKSPMLGAASFFPMAASEYYDKVYPQLIEQGMPQYQAEHEALKGAMANGAVQVLLENLVLGKWSKTWPEAKNLVKRIFSNMVMEGVVEEGTQNTTENYMEIAQTKLNRMSPDERSDYFTSGSFTKDLTKGLASSIVIGSAMGAGLGMVPPGARPTPKQLELPFDMPLAPKAPEPQGLYGDIVAMVSQKQRQAFADEGFRSEVDNAFANVVEAVADGRLSQSDAAHLFGTTADRWLKRPKPVEAPAVSSEEAVKKYTEAINKAMPTATVEEKQAALNHVLNRAGHAQGELGFGLEAPVQAEAEVAQPKVEPATPAQSVNIVLGDGTVTGDILSYDAVNDTFEVKFTSSLPGRESFIGQTVRYSGNQIRQDNPSIKLPQYPGAPAMAQSSVQGDWVQADVSPAAPGTMGKMGEVVAPPTPGVAAPAPQGARPTQAAPQGKTIPMKQGAVNIEENLPRGIAGRNLFGPDGLIAKWLGAALRLNPRLRRAWGSYAGFRGPNGTVTLKNLDSWRTLLHEYGHFFRDYFQRNQGPLAMPNIMAGSTRQRVNGRWVYTNLRAHPIWNELIAISQLDYPNGRGMFDPATDRYRASAEELFADFFSLLVRDEARVRQMAPTFFREVFDPLAAAHPEVGYMVNALRELGKELQPVLDIAYAGLQLGNQLYDNKITSTITKDVTQAKKGLLDSIYPLQKRLDALKWLQSHVDTILHSNNWLKVFAEKRGLSDAAFEMVRQFRKFVDGNILRINEELVNPIHDKEIARADQTAPSPIFQRLQTLKSNLRDEWSDITEKARLELAAVAAALNKRGMLTDETFWNHIGVHIKYIYSQRELAKLKPSPITGRIQTGIKAGLSQFKKRLSPSEFASKSIAYFVQNDPAALQPFILDKVGVDITGTRMTVKDILNKLTIPQIEKLGNDFREQYGLVTTAALPIKIGLEGAIRSIAKHDLCNSLATVPGIVGTKSMGYLQLPDNVLYGDLAGQYVHPDTYKVLIGFDKTASHWGQMFEKANQTWKTLMVPANLPSNIRNMASNFVNMMLHGVRIQRAELYPRAFEQMKTKGAVYKQLRDGGMYKHNFSTIDMGKIQDILNKTNDPATIWTKLVTVFESPARGYGAIEDFFKTVIAIDYMDQGYNVNEAVKAADKILFDYSSVSEFTQGAKKTFIPFATWSIKILPRIAELAILRPERFITSVGTILALNAIAKAMLGIDDDEEKRQKPEYMKGHLSVVLGRDPKTGQITFLDLNNYLPWGPWTPIQPRRGVMWPQAMMPGGLPLIAINGLFTGSDPITGDFIKDWMGPMDRVKARADYIAKSVLPSFLVRGADKVYDAMTGKPRRVGEASEKPLPTAASSLLGIGLVQGKTKMQMARDMDASKRNMSYALSNLKKEYQLQHISKAEFQRRAKGYMEKYKRELDKYRRQ